MYKVGLTGGIGSGKTTVAQLFADIGVPVYNADDEAKRLMITNTLLKKKIDELFQGKAYINDKLNTKYIADIVFNDMEMLQRLEALVHPVVRKDFCEWVSKQNADYVIVENAILFKSGMHKLVDCIISISASAENRISRVKIRDKLSENDIQNRINNQNNNEKLLKSSDLVIENNGFLSDLSKKVAKIDKNIKNMLKKS